MKCMICGKTTTPSVPLCFCEDCLKNRKVDVEARKAKHREWFKQIVAERKIAEHKAWLQGKQNKMIACNAKEALNEPTF